MVFRDRFRKHYIAEWLDNLHGFGGLMHRCPDDVRMQMELAA
jgi:hypothetical protein